MKRFFSFLLCLCLILSLAPAGVYADDASDYSGDYTAEEALPVYSGDTGSAEATDAAAVTDAPAETDGEAEADVPADDEEELISDSVSWTNPLYESIDFSSVESSVSTKSRMLFSARTYDAAVYTTVDSAAAYARGQMKSRSSTFSLSYQTTDTAFTGADSAGKSTYIGNLALEIFNSAMKHTGTPIEGDSLLYCCPGMVCTMSWVRSTNIITLNYNITTQAAYDSDPRVIIGFYTTAAQESELTQKIQTIISGLDLTGKSDFEKVRAIYAYICDNVAYDSTNGDTYLLKYTAYAAAINGTAVCQGIAVLFYRLALELGIDCRVIGSETAVHAWNIVELNGVYYDVDATWDETRIESTWMWFLLCPSNFQQGGCHPVEGNYAASSFTAAYPMSSTDYIGSKTLTLNLSSLGLDSSGTVYIDGVPYTLSSGSVTLPDVISKSAVAYTYNSSTATDKHTVYPTNMYVWMLKYQNGGYTATRVSAFDNILKYFGSSIRLTGSKGIRMISGIPTSLKTALKGSGSNGYTLMECGTIAAWSDTLGSDPLIKGASGVIGNYAYSRSAGTDPVYATASGYTQFTNVLTFTDMAKCVPDLALRPYIVLKDSSGTYVTLYGGIIYRNIGYIAYQNSGAFAQGTDAYSYIHSIIEYVYPNGYAA